MDKIGILFPHQLFEENALISSCDVIYLVEEWLYFRQYNFHKRKIAFHRASMKFYESYLRSKNIKVVYIDAFSELADIRKLLPDLKKNGISKIEYTDTTDFWLEQRINQTCGAIEIDIIKHPSPLFINSTEEIERFFAGRKRMFQTDFYRNQRVSRKILIDNDKQPVGGKWSFDDENRLKYPKGQTAPKTNFLTANSFYTEALVYTQKHFSDNPGELDTNFIYPTTFEESKAWLKEFLKTRFPAFGQYEDAIVTDESVLHHSVLTPMLNTGLLTPQFILEEALLYACNNEVPLNSLEGFVRQIIGWREFMRAVYDLKGREARTKNYWQFTRKIPYTFWTGTTGIEPIDSTIKKVLKTGYCHHIERLMVLGNFMLLCEFDPDEVYRWFMEMFIDAYDWVMVPNVYSMSQFADGGIMATKPYISGSNYLRKMSDYQKGEWEKIWDGLFWRFMHTHRSFFLQNPRLGMLIGSFYKMAEAKREEHLKVAEGFLSSLE